MSNPSQLFLLADHIKLSLLERQRAVSLQLEPNSQDAEISRSLESLREGLETVERDLRSREENNDSSASELKDQADNLRIQYQDLATQFNGNSPSSKNNDSSPDTAPDGEEGDAPVTRASNSTTTLKHPTPQHPVPKSVRFTDTLDDNGNGNGNGGSEDPNRAALLPYRDDPSPTTDHSGLSNEQIHSEHTQIMQQQDDQLDRLGESIGRQHQLSIQIGDELEGHVALLDDVDGHVDRHAGRLEGAKRRLGKLRRKAGGRSGIMTIIGLIILLVILIVIFK